MTFEYGKLTYLEIKAMVEEGYMAVLPTGCTEQQGPHTSVDFDTWLASELSISAAERAHEKYGAKYLVVPTLPFGPTPEHRNYGYGFIDIPQDLYEGMIYSVLKSLAQQGFKKIVIFRGCGGHHLDNVAERFNSDFSGISVAYIPHYPFYDVWCKYGDPNLSGGHADSFTTSLALFKRKETVRKDKICNPYSDEPDWEDPNLDFSKYSKTGVIGDPTQATEELGEKLWNSTVDAVADIFKDIAFI